MQKKSLKVLAALALAAGIVAVSVAPANAAVVSCQARVTTASSSVLTVSNTWVASNLRCSQVKAQAYRYSSSGGYTVVTGTLSSSSSSVVSPSGANFGQWFVAAVVIPNISITPYQSVGSGAKTVTISRNI
jgi:hypothetical protein